MDHGSGTHLRGVLEAARARRAARVDYAAAIVVATRGSTYRKPGAIALVDADGAGVGALSGGCLEPEIASAARRVLAQGKPERLVLDTRGDDDLLFGSGSGCRGTMDVLVVPQRACDADLLGALESALARDGHARLTLVVSGDAIGAWRLGDESAAGAENARLDFAAPPRALLLGAGPEAAPLARLLRGLGWVVVVADRRAALLDRARLGDADRLIHARPAAALRALDDAPIAGAILMSHHAAIDREALEALALRPCGYIGLLGPRARYAELLATLDPAQRAALEARVHGPAGLDLGGEGPEAIALSIAAALQRHVAAHAPTSPSHGAAQQAAGLHGVVLLAAGASRRLGRSKQMLRVDGVPLVRRAAQAALATAPRETIVVAGAEPALATALAGLEVRVLECADWREGMAAALRAGIAALDPACEAALVLVCDQPALDPPHLRALLDAGARDPLAAVATFYAGVRGVPALFPRAWFDALLALRGDTGARALLRAPDTRVIEVAAPRYARDVDSPADISSAVISPE